MPRSAQDHESSMVEASPPLLWAAAREASPASRRPSSLGRLQNFPGSLEVCVNHPHHDRHLIRYRSRSREPGVQQPCPLANSNRLSTRPGKHLGRQASKARLPGALCFIERIEYAAGTAISMHNAVARGNEHRFHAKWNSHCAPGCAIIFRVGVNMNCGGVAKASISVLKLVSTIQKIGKNNSKAVAQARVPSKRFACAGIV